MKHTLIASILLFFSFSLLNLSGSSYKNTSAGVGMMYGSQPETESFSIEVKRTELINRKLIVGFDTFISTPLDDASAGIISVKPSVGIFVIGDHNSDFKTILCASSGIAVTSYESNIFKDDHYYGTLSTLDLHLIYKSYGLTLTGFSVNTGNYYNSGINIGLKYWF